MAIKKFLVTVIVCVSVASMAGCGNSEKHIGAPPEDVINPDGAGSSSNTGNSADNGTAKEKGGVISGAVTVKIGLNDDTGYKIDMYNNAASETILGYLSEEEMRFPTYTYEEGDGYVAQDIRGSYTRDDEKEISQIKAGGLYLFSDGQLRLYFKDVADAGITATPVGYFADTDNITELVQNAYKENRDDSWGVEVYFLITRNIQAEKGE